MLNIEIENTRDLAVVPSLPADVVRRGFALSTQHQQPQHCFAYVQCTRVPWYSSPLRRRHTSCDSFTNYSRTSCTCRHIHLHTCAPYVGGVQTFINSFVCCNRVRSARTLRDCRLGVPASSPTATAAAARTTNSFCGTRRRDLHRLFHTHKL